jgi:hypothetical protein
VKRCLKSTGSPDCTVIPDLFHRIVAFEVIVAVEEQTVVAAEV